MFQAYLDMGRGCGVVGGTVITQQRSIIPRRRRYFV